MTREIRCWRVYVHRNGRWLLRSTCDTPKQLREVTDSIGGGVRVRIVPGTRKAAHYKEPNPPNDTRRHVEQQAEKMVLRRQAMSVFKTGSNGTEIRHVPEEVR